MISWAVRNPLVTNILLVLLLVVGTISWYSMPQEMFPVVDIDAVQVSTRFEGAPPVEVERQITVPIEEVLLDMSDIRSIESDSREGFSNIIVKLRSGTNSDEFALDLRTEIDALRSLPEVAERTKIRQLKTRFPVISVSVYGNVGEKTLAQAGEDMKRRLQELDGIAGVSIAGEREVELLVTVNPLLAAAKGVAIEEIIQALKWNLGDRPGGALNANTGEIQLRGVSFPLVLERLADLPIKTNSKGAQLQLREVAEVDFRLEEAETLGRFDGKPALNLVVTKNAGASTIEVAELVRELVANLDGKINPGVALGYHTDLSVYIKTRLDTVFASGIIGLTLLLLALYLLLDVRVALITALGIPVSFLIGVIIMQAFGFTVNMVSMFAFLVVLGMIVDDAIIVSENIYRHLEAGVPLRRAVVDGAREMAGPVVAAVLTTVAAFLPLLFISGQIGAFVMVIPAVVSGALIGSLLEAFLILPSHAEIAFRHTKLQVRKVHRVWKALLSRYADWLRRAMRVRYTVLLAVLAILAVSVVTATTRIPFQLFGKVEVDWFFVNVEAPNTFSLEHSRELAEKMEAAVARVFSGREEELETMLTNLGLHFNDFNSVDLASNYVQMTLVLAKRKPETLMERYLTPLMNFSYPPTGVRERGTEEIVALIRKELGNISDIKRFSIRRPEAGPAGPDVELGIIEADDGRLSASVLKMVAFLREIPGVYDVRHDMEPGKLEFRYQLNEKGRGLGLTSKAIADIIRTGYNGVEVVYVNRDNKRFPVRVVFPADMRKDSTLLENLPIILADGRTIYFSEVTDGDFSRGLGTVRHLDGYRMVTISADVDTEVVTALEIYGLIEERVAPGFAANPGSSLVYLGEKRDAVESFEGLYRATVVALFLVFFILVVLFRTLMAPLVVVASIPFGFVGVVFGHLLFGYNLQFVSMVGLVALIGIIVNDSLILIDETGKQLKQGLNREDALVAAGVKRFRPIVLTTVTTFLGVTPLIFFASGQTAFLSPMAVSLGFGLVFSTVLILVVLPCFYLIADDLRRNLPAFLLFSERSRE